MAWDLLLGPVFMGVLFASLASRSLRSMATRQKKLPKQIVRLLGQAHRCWLTCMT